MSASSSSGAGGLPKVAYAIAALVAVALGVAMCSKQGPSNGDGSSVGGVQHTANGDGAARVVSIPIFCQNVPDKEVTAPHPADTANPNADGNWSNGLYVPAGCTTYPDRTVLNVQCKETGGHWKNVAEDGCVGSFERYQSKTGEAIMVSIPFRPNV